MSIYQPAEDSFLLSETLEKYLKGKYRNKDKRIKILDLGSGSGIQAETCRKLGFKNILTADIDKEAVKLLRKKDFKARKSDLFSAFKDEEKFNLIVFNPPYLPENKRDKEKDTTGGKQGYETIVKFLKQAKNHLEKNREILLLFSSLSKPEIIKQKAKELGYKMKLLSKRRFFFEELYVYLLKKRYFYIEVTLINNVGKRVL